MALGSPQKCFCPACGAERQFNLLGGGRLRGYCGEDCFKEMKWREALSISGASYKPQPPTKCTRDLMADEQRFYKRLCENPIVALSNDEMPEIVVAGRLIELRLIRSLPPERRPDSISVTHRAYEAIPPVNISLFEDLDD